MIYTASKSRFRSIHQGDPGFYISDGLSVIARAGIEISPDCPHDYARMIQTAFTKGWIKNIAHVYDHELMWEELGR